jgi:hypothetical protein
LPGNQFEEGGFRVSVADNPSGAVPDTGLCACYRPATFNPEPGGEALCMNYAIAQRRKPTAHVA